MASEGEKGKDTKDERDVIRLPLELEPQADALGPEIGSSVQGCGARWAGRRYAERDTGDVHKRIDLVAGANYLAPIEERVAHRELDVRRDLVAYLDAGFRDDCKAVMCEGADIGSRQSQETARLDFGHALKGTRGGAVDDYPFVAIAERYLAEEIERPSAASNLPIQPELTA